MKGSQESTPVLAGTILIRCYSNPPARTRKHLRKMCRPKAGKTISGFDSDPNQCWMGRLPSGEFEMILLTYKIVPSHPVDQD